MSGGVDSSVSAVLLKRQGYNVVGIFMKNWEESDSEGNCTAMQDYEDALAVCTHIGIPCYSVNFSAKYWDNVFENFLSELKAGRTPNPDILCNREIKFKALLDKALELGADYLATGHYCRTQEIEGEVALLKGLDPLKDQSYFLYTLTSSVLKKVMFPIGNLPKSEVRRIAIEEGLVNARKKDSTGICFIGKRDFKSFVSQYIAYHPGDVLTTEGKVIAKHDGSAYYTIGQRHGLGIGGPGDAWFVVDKDVVTNTIVVAQGSEHPALFSTGLSAIQLSWVSSKGINPPYSCSAKVRYRQADQLCTIESGTETLQVTFQEPQRAVTPGQSIVFYAGEVCLGGGIISNKS
jgi:tRNA-specific 2-thiouridylase